MEQTLLQKIKDKFYAFKNLIKTIINKVFVLETNTKIVGLFGIAAVVFVLIGGANVVLTLVIAAGGFAIGLVFAKAFL